MRTLITALVVAGLVGVAPARAQDREPAQRQNLLELAYSLGESHALRQVCRGPLDQAWRDRMYALLEAEQADPLFEQRLKRSFNAGYLAGQSQYNRCTEQSRAAEARAADRGSSLARQLSQSGSGN